MKTRTFIKNFLIIGIISFFLTYCTQTAQKSEQTVKIENTLKSVSLFYDSIMIEPSQLLSSLEKINKAIDSIGYPDAGYKLWLIQSDTIDDFRFLLEGNWPDQEAYDIIHNHELYKNALGLEDEVWKGLKNTWYNRFIKVK